MRVEIDVEEREEDETEKGMLVAVLECYQQLVLGRLGIVRGRCVLFIIQFGWPRKLPTIPLSLDL